MEENAQHTNPNRLTARQQRLVLRAVVGTLVLSAALAAPPAFAQTAAPGSPAPAPNAGWPVNAGPFSDLLEKTARLHKEALISWEDTFELTFEAERAPDGSFRNLNTTSVAAVNGRWPELTREFVVALGDSRLLTSAVPDFERLSLTFKLDPRGAFAGLSFEVPTPARAEQLRRGYEGLLSLGLTTKRGRPEEALFRGANVSASGKQFAVTLQMPREQLGNLLRQSLALP